MLLVSCVEGPLGSYLGLSGKPEHCIVSCRTTLLMLLVSCVDGPGGLLFDYLCYLCPVSVLSCRALQLARLVLFMRN